MSSWLASVLLVSSCLAAAPEDRDDLSPAGAIVGHWKTQSGRTHYYIRDDGTITMVDDGESTEQTYKQIEEDEETGFLKIAIRTGSGGHEKEITFTSNNLGLMEVVKIPIENRKINIRTVWLYVDDAEKPRR